jgi:hypothetical protein
MYVLCMYVLCMYVNIYVTCRVTLCAALAGLKDIGILGQLHTYIHTYIGRLLVEVPTGLRDITYTYRFHFVLGLVQLQEILMSTLRDGPPA